MAAHRSRHGGQYPAGMWAGARTMIEITFLVIMIAAPVLTAICLRADNRLVGWLQHEGFAEWQARVAASTDDGPAADWKAEWRA
jgi:hypothetical protein